MDNTTRTLASIMYDYHGADQDTHVVFCDEGSGSAFYPGGQIVDYQPETMGHLIMHDVPIEKSADGVETDSASDWQYEANGYKWQVRF